MQKMRIKAKGSLSMLLFIALLPAWANAATLYMCRSYGGGSFWTNTHCRQQNALVERMVTVPDNLSFEQQVRLGEQARAEGQRLLDASPARPATSNNTQTTQNECAAIDARIQYLDQVARHPLPGPTQDAVATERRGLRDRQFQLRCR
jgi:hypothetical protein